MLRKILERVRNSSTNKSLIYTVNPLPHSLLNFVFNFGNLTEEDEKEYINNIIRDSQHKFFYDYKTGDLTDNDFEEIHKLAVNLIVTSQNFIRERNDKSSVSLREIRRFNIFFEYFFNYLKSKKEFDLKKLENKELETEDINYYKNLSYKDIQIYSIILSIFVCYYLRIPDNKTRKELCEKLNNILSQYDQNFKDFTELPFKEEKLIAQKIEMESGIAKNRALLDNIFALFVTINTKVPIFIVGKPGCSKSLSVQLITKSMKGNSSSNSFFKNLPRIVPSSFQGSMGSTSKGVKSVFKKARAVLQKLKRKKEREQNEIIIDKNEKNEDDKKIISMIFFDEMGLAEHSPNNPLKVIHAELEYDLNEGDKKVAFVGISNWALDASKMNRGLFLSIPDPEETDVKFTSYTIAESYNAELAPYNKMLYDNLGEIYYNYKQYLKNHYTNGLEEFHGNRDFYHLVKNVAKHVVKENTKNLDDNKKNVFVHEILQA